MRVTITFSCDGAAFDEPATEIARILREIAKRAERGDDAPAPGLSVFDINGNRVGQWLITH